MPTQDQTGFSRFAWRSCRWQLANGSLPLRQPRSERSWAHVWALFFMIGQPNWGAWLILYSRQHMGRLTILASMLTRQFPR